MNKILHSDRRYHRVLGIDPSTRGIACSLIVDGKITATMKINLGDGDIYHKIAKARKYFSPVLEMYKPEVVIVEQTVYIQNPETTRKLSYIVGILMGEAIHRDIYLEDVPPATWKSFIGARAIRKNEKESIIQELGLTEGRKEIQRRRKSQVQDILNERFSQFDWSDDDVADSAGIALWGYSKFGKVD